MQATLPPHPDPFGEALHSLRMSGTMYCHSEFSAPWALGLPAMRGFLMFHVLTFGKCWLEIDGDEPCLLSPGDLALVPHGKGHKLASEPGLRAPGLFDLSRDQVSKRYEILRHGGGGAVTTMLCGAVHFEPSGNAKTTSVEPIRNCCSGKSPAVAPPTSVPCHPVGVAMYWRPFTE